MFAYLFFALLIIVLVYRARGQRAATVTTVILAVILAGLVAFFSMVPYY